MGTQFEAFRGTWQAVRIETGGQGGFPPSAFGGSIAFDGDRVTLLEDGVATGAGTVSFHAVGGHPAVDVTMAKGAGSGQVALGIYEVVGERFGSASAGSDPPGSPAPGPPRSSSWRGPGLAPNRGPPNPSTR